ncbi:DDRGK domain-containing protein 1-like [Brienomyrus brachyistius]|uniref:DDRGK domain-containing protein 1-like n=1 Tax=Brienomyrus brachyistius TaxID=42636 RepID=UPI0020B198B6|nr:DDRGK domain-containing protein 1-like [Brienomyrus brachyistius]
MEVLVYVVVAVALVLLILLAIKVRGKQEAVGRVQEDAVGRVAGPHPVVDERGAGMPRRRNLNSRMTAQRQRQPQRDASDSEDSSVEEGVGPQFQPGKIGSKKKRKLEDKQAKKAQREAEQEEREERRRLQELRDQEKRKEEEKERLLEQRQEEELRRAKEEKERKEEEEYLRLKDSFVIEEQGIAEQLDEQESRNLLQEFIQYIKDSKVVLLEDLASHFEMRTQDAISRLQDLIADGSLTGVIDDRGKFIFITPEELSSVAQFIKQRGRVSITELAQASNSLINLTPVIHNTA